MVLASGNEGGLRMCHIYQVGGSVKLAKLWERSRDKAIIGKSIKIIYRWNL